MKDSRFAAACIVLIGLAAFGASVLVYPMLPPFLMSHWDINGNPNGWMLKFWGAFLLPLVLFVMIFVWWLLPRIDPIARGFPGFRYVYDFFWVLFTAFLAYIHALILGVNLGWNIDVRWCVLLPTALLIGAIGALLPAVKRNWFFGIRTPWTLSSDTVWRKTHRLASALFIFAAAVSVISIFMPPYTLALFIAPLIIAILISVGYSYILYEKHATKP